MFTAHDHFCMARALDLAKKGLYSTDPNPRVGCVISKKDRVIGEGWHARAGETHAEINAIRSANESIQGATAYVTLEPCSHHGRTPPCCEALAEGGISRVVIAMQDPNPVVSGSGIRYLQSKNISVGSGLLAEQASELNPGFISRMTRQRPWVRVKLASSLDGRSALKNGASQWITSTFARDDGHRWRARSSCILSGSGTVVHDNPALTARPANHLKALIEQPLRAIIDSQLQTPTSAKVVADQGKTLIFTAIESGKFCGYDNVELILCDTTTNGKINLHHVMQQLADRSVNELHVEAGSGLSGALVAEKLVDELLLYQAPTVLGSNARGLFDIAELNRMDAQIRFKLYDARQIGEDTRLRLRPITR